VVSLVAGFAGCLSGIDDSCPFATEKVGIGEGEGGFAHAALIDRILSREVKLITFRNVGAFIFLTLVFICTMSGYPLT
jgi:hypothetical protein